mgnify:CR=1 FL=1
MQTPIVLASNNNMTKLAESYVYMCVMSLDMHNTHVLLILKCFAKQYSLVLHIVLWYVGYSSHSSLLLSCFCDQEVVLRW